MPSNETMESIRKLVEQAVAEGAPLEWSPIGVWAEHEELLTFGEAVAWIAQWRANNKRGKK